MLPLAPVLRFSEGFEKQEGCIDVGSSLGTPLCPMQGICLKKTGYGPSAQLGLAVFRKVCPSEQDLSEPCFLPQPLAGLQNTCCLPRWVR